MILDSNIIIYAASPSGTKLRRLITNHSPAVSAISYVEVLGFNKQTDRERSFFEAFFAAAEIIPLDQPVLDQAVALRQQRKMSLGDALIAATALVYRRKLVTRNVAHIAWVDGLNLLDPFAQ